MLIHSQSCLLPVKKCTQDQYILQHHLNPEADNTVDQGWVIGQYNIHIVINFTRVCLHHLFCLYLFMHYILIDFSLLFCCQFVSKPIYYDTQVPGIKEIPSSIMNMIFFATQPRLCNRIAASSHHSSKTNQTPLSCADSYLRETGKKHYFLNQ